jgi:hypothetical protein
LRSVEDRRFRILLRSAVALALATPAAIVAACGEPFSPTAGSPNEGPDASRASAENLDAAVPEASDATDATDCVDDFDAAPLSCDAATPTQPCPQRPGVCGADGRTYCSQAHVREAGVSVVLNVACDLRCGPAVTCETLTQYCQIANVVASWQSTCVNLTDSCVTNRTCPCLEDAGLAQEGCTDRDGALYVEGFGAAAGRRPAGLVDEARPRGTPVGAWLADASRLEAASVHAFSILADELLRHGAPDELLERTRRAESDEVRHEGMTATLALRLGAERGAWADSPEVLRPPHRPLVDVAVENAVEGCVNETYGAVLALWQATHARDKGVRRAMHAIAEDETRHAALAWAVAEWAAPALDPDARRRVDGALRAALATLGERSRREPDPALVSAGLLPEPDVAACLVAAVERIVDERQPSVRR